MSPWILAKRVYMFATNGRIDTTALLMAQRTSSRQYSPDGLTIDEMGVLYGDWHGTCNRVPKTY